MEQARDQSHILCMAHERLERTSVAPGALTVVVEGSQSLASMQVGSLINLSKPRQPDWRPKGAQVTGQQMEVSLLREAIQGEVIPKALQSAGMRGNLLNLHHPRQKNSRHFHGVPDGGADVKESHVDPLLLYR